jgi:hypothetical protein
VAGDVDGNGRTDLFIGAREATLVTREGGNAFSGRVVAGRVDVPLSAGAFRRPGVAGLDLWFMWREDDGLLNPRDSGFALLERQPGGTFLSTELRDEQGEPLMSGNNPRFSRVRGGDFDRDGQVDFVSSGHEGLMLHRQVSRGVVRSTVLSAEQPDAFELVDLDGDGGLDVLARVPGEFVSILVDGTGAVRKVERQPVTPTQGELRVLDLDGDGRPDVAAVDPAEDAVHVWLRDAKGSFQPWATLRTGRAPYAVAAADLNKDGRVELLVSEAGANTLSVRTLPPQPLFEVVGAQAWTLRRSASASCAPSGGPTVLDSPALAARDRFPAPAVGDFNRDGRLDVVTRLPTGGFRLFLNQGNGAFTARDEALSIQVISVAALDANRDGWTDLAVTAGRLGEDEPRLGVRLLWNDRGSFSSRPFMQVAPDFGPEAHVSAADLDGDGDQDLVLLARGNGVPGASKLLNSGDGNFRGAPWLADLNFEPDDTAANLTLPLIADFNRDGVLDLAFRTLGLNLYLNARNGGQLAGAAFSPAGERLSVGDLDGDGIVDVVDALPDGSIAVMRGDRGWTLLRGEKVELSGTASGFSALDVNGDGRTDLVGFAREGNAAVVLYGEGKGVYGAEVRYPLPARPVWAGAANLLGDAKPELLLVLETGQVALVPTGCR